MDNFEYANSTHYYFGQGYEKNVGEYLKVRGASSVLIVYGQDSCISSGLLAIVKESLNDSELKFCELSGVCPNQNSDIVYKGKEIAIANNVDYILAIGGGSVIDIAKLISIARFYEGDFFEVFFEKHEITKRALNIGVIVTIASAGAEGSKIVLAKSHKNNKAIKKVYSSPLLIPKFAILNPELTFSVPHKETACGIVEMFCHVMARYFTNSLDVSLSDRLCEALMLSIIESSSKVLKDPYDYGARANLLWASNLAHNDLCSSGSELDWVTHHVADLMTTLYDVSQGESLSIIFPAWMDYTLGHNIMRFAQFAHRVFNIPMDFDDPVRTARSGIKAIRIFFKSLSMPLSFKDINAKEEDIPFMLNTLGIEDKTEGNFMRLNRNDFDQLFKLAARFSVDKW